MRHEARARVYTRDAPAGYFDTPKSKHTQVKTQQRALFSLTAVLLHAAGLAGPASVIKPTQQRQTKPNLKHIEADEAWPECLLPPGFQG